MHEPLTVVFRWAAAGLASRTAIATVAAITTSHAAIIAASTLQPASRNECRQRHVRRTIDHATIHAAERLSRALYGGHHGGLDTLLRCVLSLLPACLCNERLAVVFKRPATNTAANSRAVAAIAAAVHTVRRPS
jgi:hypothetical protein